MDSWFHRERGTKDIQSRSLAQKEVAQQCLRNDYSDFSCW